MKQGKRLFLAVMVAAVTFTTGSRAQLLDQLSPYGETFADASSAVLRKVEAFQAERRRRGGDAADLKFVPGVASSLEKVFQERAWFRGEITDKVGLSAARNEHEAAQVCVIPLADNALRNVTVTWSDLTGEEGATIPKRNVNLYLVGYVLTRQPSYPAAFVGNHPDPLLPLAPFNVAEGKVQPLWVDVYVPPDARAGAYKGTLTIKPVDLPAQNVELHLKVWNFTLPQETHLRTAFGVSTDDLQRVYQAKDPAMFLKYCDALLERRLSPWHVATAFPEHADVYVEHALALGITAFEAPAMTDEIYRRWEQKGWLDKAFNYLFDEPAPEQYPQVLERGRESKDQFPKLKRLLAESPHPDLVGAVDIWASLIDTDEPAQSAARARAGDEVWWYVAGLPIRCEPKQPHHLYPNLLIDEPALDHRILFWMMHKFGIKGFLYWGATSWGANTAFYGGDWDPLMTGTGLWTGLRANGDGCLLYPLVDRPTPSIRLEVLRDGVEDYEYLHLLSERADELEEKKNGFDVEVIEARELGAIADSLVTNAHTFNRDPQALLNYRERVAQSIENLSRYLEMPPPPRYLCHRALDDLVIDGRIVEKSWTKAAPITFITLNEGQKPEKKYYTEARMLWDDYYLYIAFKCFDPDVWSTFQKRDEPLYNQEVVEAFIQANPNMNAYLELEVSPLNVIWDGWIVKQPRRAGIITDLAWNAQGLATVVRGEGTVNDDSDEDKFWAVEMAIPLDAIPFSNVFPAQEGAVWRFNLYRIERPQRDKGPPLLLTWSFATGWFHNPWRFGELVFAK